MTSLVLSSFTAVNALGRGNAAVYEALAGARTGLKPCTFENVALETYTGEVAGLEEMRVSTRLAEFDCRNNRLAELALRQDGFAERVAQARKKYGAHRVAVILGTSTSGILDTEHAYRKRDPNTGALPPDFRFTTTHNLYASTDFVRRYLDLQGPAAMLSTACSSSAKVFASAARLIAHDLCDAAVVGGVDSLCRNTLYGFASLDLVGREPCRPCDAQRGGISIGEAAGFALLERPQQAEVHSGVALLGYGESSDAYHMSSPHPEGEGAALAMRRALANAGLEPGQIDYINMHGTASQANDSMEDKAISALFGRDIPASSTKGWTGHALGAAGITEAVIAALCIQNGFMPGCLNARRIDPGFTSNVLLTNQRAAVQRVLSNSFGFGGSNACLIFGAHP